jgi:peptide subunit release factor 1 (eRF1)
MVTDPVERIREFTHETPLALDLPATLARLVALPPAAAAPYLTLCLDWRPEGTEPGRIERPQPKRSQRRARGDESVPRRPAWQEMRRELAVMVEQHGPRGAGFDSLSRAVARIEAYLEDELDPAAQGVVIVAGGDADVFEPVPLDAAVATSFTVGPIPSLRGLIQAAEDAPPYAVLVADQRDAVLWLMDHRTWERAVHLEADGYPRKQQQGGWSQKRYQARADERVEHFAKTIAEETRKEIAAGEPGIPYLIIAAEEPMSSALDTAFHQTVTERVIGRISVSPEDGITQIAARAAPLVERQERQREMAAVQAARDGAGEGTGGVTGIEETLTALQSGQVMTLVMNDDFSRAGWADYTLPVYGVDDVPREHPAGGDAADMVPTALEDEVVRLALQTDADVELVQSAVPVGGEELEQIPDATEPMPRAAAARALDELGGIAATLRFALDAEQPVAEM